jgi:hypothetical protein
MWRSEVRSAGLSLGVMSVVLAGLSCPAITVPQDGVDQGTDTSSQAPDGTDRQQTPNQEFSQLSTIEESTPLLPVLEQGTAVKLEFVSSLSLHGGCAEEIDISGVYCYIASSNNGLQIVDVSDPDHPQLIGSGDQDEEVHDVKVHGQYAFVADNQGLGIFDVSNTTTMQLKRHIDMWGPFGMAAYGSTVWAATQGHVSAYDIESGALLGSYDRESIWTVAVDSAGHAYLLSGSAGIDILELSSGAPSGITRIGGVTSWGSHLTISGDYAYTTGPGFGSGLRISDIHDVAHASELSVTHTHNLDEARGVALSGKYLLLAQNSGVQMFDVSDPVHPGYVTSYDGLSLVYSVAASGN